MMMFIQTRKVLALLVFWAVSSLFSVNVLADALSLGGAEVAPPKYEITDVNQVNMLTGQVSPSLNTIAIGGDKGLSHSISMFANDFTYKGIRGYTDKYVGRAKYTFLGNNRYYPKVIVPQLAVMRVYAAVGSADFLIIDGEGLADLYVTQNTIPSGYTYKAIGDKRHTLEAVDNEKGLLWTLPDGTTVRFDRDLKRNALSSGYVKNITYPSGFKITHHGLSGVTTNTGFQLKYDYTAINTGLDSSKKDVILPLSPNGTVGWEQSNPEYVRAINNAVEYCDPTLYDACTLSNSWPEVKFTWPGGMPRAFFIGDSIFQVDVSMAGDSLNKQTLTTKYHYQAQDLALEYPDLGDVDGNEKSDQRTRGYAIGEEFMTRLVGIQPANSTTTSITYRYRNAYDWRHQPAMWWTSSFYEWLSSKSGEIVAASGPAGSTSYELNLATGEDPEQPVKNTSRWKEYLSVTRSMQYSGVLTEVHKTSTGNIFFEQNHRNFVTHMNSGPGPSKSYRYDARNNLDLITLPSNQNGAVTIQAYYPETCDNRKTCNQPEYTIDAKGHRTDFTYHPASGQIASVTRPAVKTDASSTAVRPVTTYGYTLTNATYKIDSEVAQASTDGIWLLTSETSCHKAACTGADLTSTTYEYTLGNLLLKGMVVESNSTTKRICYAYDIYGNRIGETKPKGTASLSECP